MSNRSRVLAAAKVGLAVAGLSALAPGPAATARAGMITQTATLKPQTTDFALVGNSSAKGTPLVFQQFDTHDGALTLDAVNLTVNATINNQFTMTFTTPTASTITDSAYKVFDDPAHGVLAKDPASSTPSITIFAPDGKTPVLSYQAPFDASKLALAHTGTIGQSYVSDPVALTSTKTFNLTDRNALALFTGTGSLSLPVNAAAYSTILSSSGNGAGSVSTTGSASITVSYVYHDTIPAGQIVPEPTSVALWALGGGLLALRYRRRG